MKASASPSPNDDPSPHPSKSSTPYIPQKIRFVYLIHNWPLLLARTPPLTISNEILKSLENWPLLLPFLSPRLRLRFFHSALHPMETLITLIRRSILTVALVCSAVVFRRRKCFSRRTRVFSWGDVCIGLEEPLSDELDMIDHLRLV